MIKKFSFPKIWFEPMFLTGSLAVFIGAAPPHFQNFAGGFPRRLRRRKQAPVICGSPASGLAAFFDNFKFFFGGKFLNYELQKRNNFTGKIPYLSVQQLLL